MTSKKTTKFTLNKIINWDAMKENKESVKKVSRIMILAALHIHFRINELVQSNNQTAMIKNLTVK